MKETMTEDQETSYPSSIQMLTAESSSIELYQELCKVIEELEEYRSIAENIGAEKAVSEKEKAIRERDEARKIIAAALSILPCGHIPSHTPESVPDRIRELLESWVTAEHELEKAVAERDEAREKAERYRLEANAMMAKLHELQTYADKLSVGLPARMLLRGDEGSVGLQGQSLGHV
jgi:uncharacterized coiled-coil DUF342 family protein